MPTPIAQFARAASDASRARTAFEARQSIRAGRIEVDARVRVLLPDRIIVDYSAYTSPLADMDDFLGGHAELAPDDLVGASLFCDGRATWFVSPKTETALSTPGRMLYEPIPGHDALGEVWFLNDLAHDFLLRDGGETVHSGREARVIGLKPKRRRESSLFCATTFLVERAEVTLDVETYFPLRIRFLPGRGSSAVSLLGPEEWITIEYADARPVELPESAFTPTLPDGMRTLSETFLEPDDAPGRVPFPLPVGTLRERGYRPADGPALVVLSADRDRGYATLFCSTADEHGNATSALVLRVGNYVSRLMARRRILAGERGEPVEICGQAARYLDRSALWAENVPGSEPPLLAELVWERDGVFWVLTSEGLPKADLLTLAGALG